MLIVTPAPFKTWDELTPLATQFVSEAPIFVIQDALKEAAREFFRKSTVWRSAEATLLTTVAGTQGYAHTPATNAELVRVFSCWNGTTEVLPEIEGEAWDMPAADTSSSTFAIGVRDKTTLWLTVAPQTSGTVLKGSVIYTTGSDATGIPHLAFREWGRHIAAGAGALMCAQPNRQWTNPGLVGDLRFIFDAGVRMAQSHVGVTRRNPLRTAI